MIPAVEPDFSNVITVPGFFNKPPALGSGGLNPPGGGGTYDEMLEARVASLEVDVRNIRENIGEMKLDLRSAAKDLTDIKVSNTGLDIRVQNLPTFKQTFALLSAMLVLMGLLIVFQGNIQKYVSTPSAAASGKKL
jgi:hypothetical protein